jgi:hypothetical protein
MAAYQPVVQACGTPHAYDFIIVCISWNNKKCLDTIDARCNHEDHQMSSGYETKKDNRNHADTVHGKTFSVILLLIGKTNVNHAGIFEHTKHRTKQRVSLKSGQGFGSVRFKRVYLPIEVLSRPSHLMIYTNSIYIFIYGHPVHT